MSRARSSSSTNLAAAIGGPQERKFIGISGEDAYWSLRMTGIVLLPLGYLMIVVRNNSSNYVVRTFAILMSLVSLALGIVTLLAPLTTAG